MTPQETIQAIRELSGRGLSQREIANRVGLKKSTVFGILKGEHGLSAKKAEQITPNVQNAEGYYTASVVNQSGQQQFIAPVNAEESKKLGHYLHAVREYARGNPKPLNELKVKYIWIETPQGKRKFYLNRDRESIRQLADMNRIKDFTFRRYKGKEIEKEIEM